MHHEMPNSPCNGTSYQKRQCAKPERRGHKQIKGQAGAESHDGTATRSCDHPGSNREHKTGIGNDTGDAELLEQKPLKHHCSCDQQNIAKGRR